MGGPQNPGIAKISFTPPSWQCQDFEFLERPPFPTSDMMKGVYIMISKEVLEKFRIFNSCRLLIPES